jgi:acetyl esterase/lipase
MKPSLTYYLTLFVIKLKGIKKNFSEDPINYKKVRKEDIHQPKGKFFKQNLVSKFKVADSLITELKQEKGSNKLLLFIHGGAFISGPVKHHWDSIKIIFKQTNHTVWMCDYPKAPENKISEISKNIDAVYKTALEKYPSKNITLIGDSVGATLIAALTQRLVKHNINLPFKLILVSPVMDASMTNPDIDKIDSVDPILSKKGVLSAKTLCADNDDLKNEIISPLYGSFVNFPPTVLFLAENDITYPDQRLVIEQLTKAKVTHEVVVGNKMPHIWPFLPVMKEAKTALKQIINILNS